MKLAAYARAVSIDEMRRAERLTGRLLLGGSAELPAAVHVAIGQNVQEIARRGPGADSCYEIA
jgi:bacterioferritin (cytochrome b1)